MKKVCVVIPTYNEKGNIENIIAEDLKINPNISILIVDDNSPDGTGEIVDNLIKSKTYGDKLHIIHRKGKLGLGTAYIEGFKWGLQNGFDIFISQDADFSHNPIYIKDMLDLIEKGNDLVIGSRYVKGGSVVNWGLIRKCISRGGSLYSRILLLTNIKDLTGGYNCYTRKSLEKINLDTIISNGYCFQIEMKFRNVLAKLKIAETPIVFEDRRVGKSKMSKKIFIEAMINVFFMSFKRNKIKNLMH
ncbi:polyprenol monophosphomannose synthase [bacterium]|nr:polyprenol monophosphomannose synthase [bacterium]